MKNGLILFLTIAATACFGQVFDGTHPGTPLMGKQGMFDGSSVTNTQAPIGNAAGLTNFAGLILTNSGANWLTSGGAKTAPGVGFVSIQIVTTNAQICIVTNVTATIGFSVGSITGLSTNYNDVQLFVNKNDSVLVTNVTGVPLLLNSYFQALQ